MTVSNSSNKSGPYVGDGVTTVFPRTFKIISESHLVVYFVVSGVDSVQSSGFTVDGVGAETGNVTFQTAPTVGTSVLLSRSVPLVQETDYVSQGSVDPEQIEADLDDLQMQIQDLSEQTSRSIKGPIDGGALLNLPTPESGRTLIGNPTGDGFLNGPSADEISNAASYAAQAAASASDASASAARYFESLTEIVSSTILIAGDVTHVSGMGDFDIVAASTYTADDLDVFDLTGSGLQAARKSSPWQARSVASFTQAIANTSVGQTFIAGGLEYVNDPTVTTYSAGSTLTPAVDGVAVYGKSVSPAHFGAESGVSSDAAIEVQAAATYVKNSWNASNWAFDHSLDFLGKVYRSDTSIDFSGLRQPNLTVRNGQLYSRATGAIAFDMSGTNAPIVDNFTVFGAKDAAPDWGFCIGRALIGGVYGGVDGAMFNGDAGAWGFFERGALLSMAAEVTDYSKGFFQNKSRNTSACVLAIVDNMTTISNRFGTPTTSAFQTIPSVSSGRHSNITHNMGRSLVRFVSDINLTITGITQANPAVVTVTSSTLSGASLSNGDEVYISSGDMTEVSYKTFTVANIDTGADTFELMGIDSTSYTPYTSGGTLQNKTGVPYLQAGAKNLSIDSPYILSYGSPTFEIDLITGGAPANWDINYQSERNVDKQITFVLDTGTVVLQNLNITSANLNQTAETSIMWIDGAGTVRLDGGYLTVPNMSTAPSAGLMSPASQFDCQSFNITAALSAGLPVK